MRQVPILLQSGTTATASQNLQWLRIELGLDRREAQAVLGSTPRLLTCRVSEAGCKLLDFFYAKLGLEKARIRPVSAGFALPRC